MDYIIPKIHKMKKDKMISQLDDKVLSNNKLKEMHKKVEAETSSFGGEVESRRPENELLPLKILKDSASINKKPEASKKTKVHSSKSTPHSSNLSLVAIQSPVAVQVKNEILSKTSPIKSVISPERKVFQTQKTYSSESEDPNEKSFSPNNKISSKKKVTSPEREIFQTQKTHSSDSEVFPFTNAPESKISTSNKKVVSPDGKVSSNKRVVSPERKVFQTPKTHSTESEDPIEKSSSPDNKISSKKKVTSPEREIFPTQEMYSSESNIFPINNADSADRKGSPTENNFSPENDIYPIKKMELLSHNPTYFPVSKTSPVKTLKPDEKKKSAANKEELIANQRYSPDSKFSPLKNVSYSTSITSFPKSKYSPILKRVDSENSFVAVSPMIQKTDTSTYLENSKEKKVSSGVKIPDIIKKSPNSPQITYSPIKKIESPFFEFAKQKSSQEKFSPPLSKGDLPLMLQIKQLKEKKVFSSTMHKAYVEIGIQTEAENPSSVLEVNKDFSLKNTIFSYKKNEEDEIKNVRKNNSNSNVVLFASEGLLLENHQKISKETEMSRHETETSAVKELHQNISKLKQDAGNENNFNKPEKNVKVVKHSRTKNLLFHSNSSGENSINLLELDLRDKNTLPQIINEETSTATQPSQNSHSNIAPFKTTEKKKSQASNNLITSPLLLPSGTNVSSFSTPSMTFVSSSSVVNVFTPTNQSYSPHLKKSTIFQKENKIAHGEDFSNDEYLKKRRIITFVEPSNNLVSLETQFTAKTHDTLQKTNYKKSQTLNFASLTKYSPRFPKQDEPFKLMMSNDYTNGSSKFSIDQINESFRLEKEILKKKTSSKPHEDRYQLTVNGNNDVKSTKVPQPSNYPLLVPSTLPKTKNLLLSSKYSSQKTNNRKETEEKFKLVQNKVLSADMIRVSALSLEGLKGSQNLSSAVNDKISKSFLSNKADILSFINNKADTKNDAFTKTFSVVEINKNFRKENILDIKEPLYIDDEKKNDVIKRDLGIKSGFKPYMKKDSLFLGQTLSSKSNEKVSFIMFFLLVHYVHVHMQNMHTT